MPEKMPFPTRRRALELGAIYLETELDDMRRRMVEAERRIHELEERHPEAEGLYVPPLSTSHEADLMKAVEWATCAAALRALAESEPPEGTRRR